jgi:hypothetical protein
MAHHPIHILKETVMSQTRRINLAAMVIGFATIVVTHAIAQRDAQPTNDLPNSYKSVEGWAKLPAGRS